MDKALQDALDELRSYCAKYEKVAIYGAGNTGRMAAKLLKEQGMEFACFCSTKKSKDFFEGHEVKAVDEISGKDTGIILAVAMKSLWEVRFLLDARHITYYCSDAFLHELLVMEAEEDIHKIRIEDGYLVRAGDLSFDRDTLYLVCTGGIGDTLYCLSLMGAYRRSHPEIRKACLVLRERHRELEGLFPGFDDVMVLPDGPMNIFSRHLVYSNCYRLKNYMQGRGGSGAIRERFWKHAMGLPEDTPMAFPDLYGKQGAPRKQDRTVVVMPHAKSTALLPDSFWNALVPALKEQGYTVYTNAASRDHERVLDGTLPMDKGLLETAVFCEGCDAVISLRSGICDLLGFSKAKLIVLNSAEDFFQYWNLKEVFGRPDIYNVNCFQGADSQETVRQIMDIVVRQPGRTPYEG